VDFLDLLISPKAEKQLLSLPKEIQENIRKNPNILLDEGLNSSIDIKKLAGYSSHYRIRIGEYRVRMEFEKPDKLKIYWIGKRSKAYND
jgi:mRNA interferase RelE/StbE